MPSLSRITKWRPFKSSTSASLPLDPSGETSGPRNSRAESSRPRLIIGIDYGTSYSGVAYALLRSRDRPDDVHVSVVRNWAGHKPGQFASNKVASDLGFDASGNLSWGFDIPDSEDTRKLKWVKLLLEPEQKLESLEDFNEIKDTRASLTDLGYSEIQVASRYLRCLWEHTKKIIVSDLGEAIFGYARKTIVLSVPAVWSDQAKHNTWLAAVNAGLQEQGSLLRMVNEPEAAAIAILSEKKRCPQEGECFVVCDAGGGTVDLISYEITATNPLRMKERVTGEGGLCGSVFLDIKFKNILRTFLRSQFDEMPHQNLVKVMSDFEDGVKRQFTNDNEKSYSVFLPGNFPDNSRIQLKDGHMKLQPDQLRAVFQPVIAEIERLIRRQVQDLENHQITPKAILLVGGFGSNVYLRQKLEKRYETKIEILQPDTSWESVATGAVRCELLGFGNVVSIHRSRLHYGIATVELFDPERHLRDEKYLCKYEGVDKVKDQVAWLLSKGQEINNGHSAIFKFDTLFTDDDDDLTSATVESTATILRSDEDQAPSRHTSAVHVLITTRPKFSREYIMKYKSQSVDGRLRYFKVPFEIEMKMGEHLEFISIIDGKKEVLQEVDYHTALS